MRRVWSHLWSQGGGPWRGAPCVFPRTVIAFCGEPIREGGWWLGRSAMTVELLMHRPDERIALCRACAAVVARYPMRCPAGPGCTGDMTCGGVPSVSAVQRAVAPVPSE